MGPQSVAEEGVRLVAGCPSPSPETMGSAGVAIYLWAVLWSWSQLQAIAPRIVLPYRTSLFAGNTRNSCMH